MPHMSNLNWLIILFLLLPIIMILVFLMNKNIILKIV